ncbi:MAG: hypothetical protein M5U09_09375 [Gammaproteobacteria bacterium]|nr:hypothetical protein [Gammaproteobacteria bacterium]
MARGPTACSPSRSSPRPRRFSSAGGPAAAGGDDPSSRRSSFARPRSALALGGYETAVEALRGRRGRGAARPRHRRAPYDAHALLGYLNAYGWEIRQRARGGLGRGARPGSSGTADQIVAEADRAFARVWTRRETLGELAPGRARRSCAQRLPEDP